MTDLVAEPGDATPFTEAERQGLLLPVLTRAELNRAEAENIVGAMSWLFLSNRRLRPESVTNEEWLKRLHRRMYGQVWAWAGQYRTADRNLGVPYWHIRMDVSDALIVALGGTRFTWGGRSLTEPGTLRRAYIKALRAADNDADLGPLLAFARA